MCSFAGVTNGAVFQARLPDQVQKVQKGQHNGSGKQAGEHPRWKDRLLLLGEKLLRWVDRRDNTRFQWDLRVPPDNDPLDFDGYSLSCRPSHRPVVDLTVPR